MEAEVMGGALRILQIGELRLETPLKGDFSSFPQDIQTRIYNSKFHTTENLFATAITEKVDLVLLAGSATSPLGGTRPYWFLKKEFEQLARHGIKVVCVEPSDQNFWSEEIPLPENVHLLARSQSIGFRVAKSQSPIEVEWEVARSSEEYDRRVGFNIRLNEFAGRVVTVDYSAQENLKPAIVEVNHLQADSPTEPRPCGGVLVELSPEHGIHQTEVQSNTLQWDVLSIDVESDDDCESLVERIDAQILNLDKDLRPHQSLCLTSISLRCKQRNQLDYRSVDLKAILRACQQKSFNRGASVIPFAINTLSESGQDFSELPKNLKFAFDELAIIQLEDVYENLDLHVLEFESNTFESSKKLAAQRLSCLLNDTCV